MKHPLTIEIVAKLERDSRLSKSKLTTYAICPYRYKLIYVDDRFDELLQSTSSQLGQKFHGYAYSFFDKISREDLEEIESLADAKKLFMSLFKIEMPLLREWYVNFCDFEAHHLMTLKSNNLDLNYFFPYKREYLLESEDFVGIIDRIDLLTNGTLAVIEYKTSPFWSVQQLKSETNFYAYWLNKINPFNKKVSMVGAYNPNVNKYFFSDVTSWSIRGVERRIKRFKQQIEKKEFPKKYSTFCRYCEFARECLFGGE